MTKHLIQFGEIHTCINNASPAFETKEGFNKYIPVKQIGEVVYILSTNDDNDDLLTSVLAENPYIEASVSLEDDLFEMMPVERFHTFFKADNRTEIYESVIEVGIDVANQMQMILDITEGRYEDAGGEDVIRVFDTEFVTPYGRYVTDIKVCNGDTPFVDSVLFEDVGNNHLQEVQVLDVDDTLFGDYEFEISVIDEEKQELSLILITVVKIKEEEVEPSMQPLKVIELFSTADKDNNYLDISAERKDCEEWLRNGDGNAVSIIQGYGIVHSNTNKMCDDALDFHYSKEEAEKECALLTFAYNLFV